MCSPCLGHQCPESAFTSLKNTYNQSPFHCNKDCTVQHCSAPPHPITIPSLCLSLSLYLLPGHPAPLSLLDTRRGSKWLTLAISLLQNSLGTRILLQAEDKMGLGCFWGNQPTQLNTLFSPEAQKLQHHKYYRE